MVYKRLIFEKKNGLATLTLNRPDALNALNKELIAEIVAALIDIERDDSVKVVVIKGAGKAFCAGADLKELEGLEAGRDPGFSTIWDRIENLSKPVIAAVHGFAITGGFLLAYSCDLIIASEDATFADTHARWGLIPTGGETQRLPRKIGGMRAKLMMFTSEPIDAKEAERIGLVTKVVPRDKLDEEVNTLVQKLLKNAPTSISAIKRLINRGMEVDFATGLRMELLNNRFGYTTVDPDPERDSRLNAFKGKDAKAFKEEKKG